jgi:LemA protein
MKKLIVTLVILGLLVLVLGSKGCGTYNRLVSMEEGVDAAWSQVENVYQRRADLVPNLVETVKGAASFEKETLTAVIEARAKATSVNLKVDEKLLANPEAFRQFQEAQGELGAALSRLLVTIERYPELKANKNFLALQSQLEGTENRIAVERRKFNETARTYNATIRRVPERFIAGFAGLEKKPYFEAESGAETAPKVQF